jgi:hypothetical protein
MNSDPFEALRRSLAAGNTRRRLLGGLAALPVVVGLGMPATGSAARKRRGSGARRGDDEHGHGDGNGHGHGHGHGHGGGHCKPKSREKICAGKCGPVKNRDTCWETIDCGSSDTWVNQTTFVGSKGDGVNQISVAYGLALSGDGLTAWIADSFNSRISVWTRPGANSTAWSNQTTIGSEGSGPTQFTNPSGVAVSPTGQTLWVSDTSNNRLSVWTRPDASSTAWSNQATFGS